MKIVHVCAYSLYSGPVAPMHQLAEAQRRLGHEVTICLDRLRGQHSPYEEAAEPRIEHSILGPKDLLLSPKTPILQVFSDRKRLGALIGDADIVHCHQSHDHTLLRTLGRIRPKIVRSIHANRNISKRVFLRFLSGTTDGWLLRAESDARALSAILPRAKSAVIKASINTNFFYPPTAVMRQKARARFGIPENARVLGQTALLSGVRGHFELCEALMEFESVLTWLVVGRGHREEDIQKKSKSLPRHIDIRFVGYQKAELLRESYWAMDAAFVGAVGNDGGARAALEAMATGIPVVATSDGALFELPIDEVGYRVSLDSKDLRQGLARWYADEEDSRVRGGRAREFALEAMQPAIEAEKTLAFYRELIGTL